MELFNIEISEKNIKPVLKFNSKFECGNLFCAFKKSP